MSVLYCSSKETKRKFVNEKAGASLYEEELRDATQGDIQYKVSQSLTHYHTTRSDAQGSDAARPIVGRGEGTWC